ncbi:MAG TPA: cytochrome c [Acidobacteriaceae bacterium]|nr:cytochrome c [Acidobacteriaceae bacterium]
MSAKAKQGEALFHQHCITCHNKQPEDESPFGPPNLHGIFGDHPKVKTPVTPQQAMQIIKNGWAPMPPFGGVLNNAQIQALIAYLKSQ